MPYPVTSRSFSAFSLILGRLTASIFTLLSVVILTRMLSKNDFGLYQQVWLVYNTVVPFMILGLPSGVTYFVADGDPKFQKTILFHVAVLLGLAGFIVSAGTYIFSHFLSDGFGEGLPQLLRLFFWFPILSFPLLVMDVYLIATHRSGTSAVLTIISSLLQFTAVVLPVSLGYGLEVMIHTVCFSALVRVLFFAPVILKGSPSTKFRWDNKLVIKILTYSVPLGAASVLGTLVLQTGKIIVATEFTAEDYAVFDVTARELPFIGILTGSIMSVVAPDFVRLHKYRNFKDMLRLFHASALKTAIILIPLTIYLSIFSKDVVIALFSSKYVDGSNIFLVYLLFLPLRIVNYGALLMAAGKTRLIFWAHLIGIPLSILFSVILMKHFSLVGVALGTILSVYIIAVILLVFCCRVLESSMRYILPWGALSRFFLASLVAALLAHLGTLGTEEGIIRALLGASIFGLCISVLGFLMKDAREEAVSVFLPIYRSIFRRSS